MRLAVVLRLVVMGFVEGFVLWLLLTTILGVIVAVAVFPKSNELLKSVLMITKTKWRTLEVAILCSGKNKFERGFIHRFIVP